MAYDIVSKIIGSIITFIVSGLLGYCLNMIKNYKGRDKTQEEALKCLLRSNITSKYYEYSLKKEIPYYEKENLNYMFEQYKKMNGNSYVEKIMDEINHLPVSTSIEE